MSWDKRACGACGSEHLLEVEGALCFNCDRASKPSRYDSLLILIDAAGDDSQDPRRVADGSYRFNVGLPGVETVIGTRPDGKPATSYRPISNNEVGSARKAKEIAKRAGLVPLDAGGRYRSAAPLSGSR